MTTKLDWQKMNAECARIYADRKAKEHNCNEGRLCACGEPVVSDPSIEMIACRACAKAHYTRAAGRREWRSLEEECYTHDDGSA